jgi:hypothetical protein
MGRPNTCLAGPFYYRIKQTRLAPYGTYDQQQDNCANEGYQDLAKDAPAKTNAERRKEPAADNGAQNTNQDGAHQANTNAANDSVSQQTGDTTDDNPNYERL